MFSFIANSSITTAFSISDELLGVVITAGIPALISIVGFIVTYCSMKKSFKNELSHERDSVALEKMSEIPLKVLDLFEQIQKGSHIQNQTQKQQQEFISNTTKLLCTILNTTYSYGSEKAIKLMSMMQSENYYREAHPSQGDTYRIMAFYVLLATQIKYDVTEIAISPELWYRMKIKDYETQKENIVNANNKIVKELNLINEFLIK